MSRSGPELRESALPDAGRDLARPFFLTGLVVATLSVGIFATFAAGSVRATYYALAWASAAVALVFAVAGWWARRATSAQAVTAAVSVAMAFVFLVAIGLGEGVHAVALGFAGVLVVTVTVIVGLRTGMAMAAASVVAVIALFVAEVAGWLPGASAVPASPLAMRLLTLLMMLAAALVVGGMVLRYVTRHVRVLTEREARYRALFEALPVGLLLHRDGEIVEANPIAQALLGIADPLLPVEPKNPSIDALLAHAAPLDEAIIGAQIAKGEVAIPGLAGTPRLLLATAIRIAEGGAPATLSMFQDDTERALAEAASRRAQVQLTNLFAASPDCIMLSDATTGRVVMVNDELLAVAGLARDDVIGKTSEQLGLWTSSDEHARFRTALNTHGSVADMPVRFSIPSGRTLSMQLSGRLFAIDGSPYAVVVARDVTQADRLRRELQIVLENAPIAVAYTRDNRIVRVNAAAEAMFGFGPGKLEGLPIDGLVDDIDAFTAVVQGADEQLAAGLLVDVEVRFRRADRSTFLCRVRGRALDPQRIDEGGTVWICEDVSEARALQQALATARDDAEAASRAKSAFLANFGHEIRTPLNGIIGLARLAGQARVDDTKRLAYLRQIEQSAENLTAILGDVLDMAKIEHGRLVLEETSFDLAELLRDVHATYSAMAAARGIDCSLTIADAVPTRVCGDPMRVRQVVVNFVANAVKFTVDGAIDIAATVVPGGVRIAVRDTGIGIAEGVLDKLFKPFTQADESTTRRYGGTGLGLSICRELATLMGGTVGAVSQLGRGSEFWAELPLTAAAGSPMPTVRGGDLTALRGARVLIVDDNPVNLLITGALADEWAMAVTEAADGETALRAVAAARREGRPFACVLMDVQLPRMDGVETTHRLRADFAEAAPPVIGLSASDAAADRTRALAAGMADYVTKPIDRDALLQALLRSVGQQLEPAADGTVAGRATGQ